MKPNCSVDSHGDELVGLVKKYLAKPQTLQSILILNFMIWYGGGGTVVIKTALLRILNGWPGGLAFPTGLEVTCAIG